MAIGTKVRISPAGVYRIPINALGKRKVCAQWRLHVLSDHQRAMGVLATTHLQH
jgi:hypothetical protein